MEYTFWEKSAVINTNKHVCSHDDKHYYIILLFFLLEKSFKVMKSDGGKRVNFKKVSKWKNLVRWENVIAIVETFALITNNNYTTFTTLKNIYLYLE